MRAGTIWKRCASCYRKFGENDSARVCGKNDCASRKFSWAYTIDTAPAGQPRKVQTRSGFASKGGAEAAVSTLKSELDDGTHVEPSKLTVHAYLLDHWLPAMELQSIEETTLVGYRGTIERYVLPRIGNDLLQSLTPPRLNGLYADVRDNGRTRATDPLDPATVHDPLSAKTVREVHVTLHKALADAEDWGMVKRNPAAKANPPSATAARNQGRAKVKVWTAEQVDTFAAWLLVNLPALFPVWFLAISTGMRRSELCGLRWSDVDLDRSRLAVRQVLVVPDGRPKFKDAPKSDNGFRTLRLSPRALAMLRRLRTEQLEARLTAGAEWEDNGLVFCHHTADLSNGTPPGRWFHPDYVTETLREAIEGSGLPKIRPLQDMRHSHATILLLSGEHMKVVQERLGHHSYAFTADTYTHTIDGMDAAAADLFDVAVFGDHVGAAEAQ